MSKAERRALGAHFTGEADILEVVLPTIVRPWRARIDAATSLCELLERSAELRRLRVLDPACGSGDFLFIAHRELARLGLALLKRILAELPTAEERERAAASAPLVSVRQLHGIDISERAVELARETLLLGERLAHEELLTSLRALGLDNQANQTLPALSRDDLPLSCGDALFCPWPDADVIIGNPPFQSKNRMQQELGAAYVRKLRERYPLIPGRADYCVYWFRRAHDHLPEGGRAGLVGTNTIRQNASREGGLDYIVRNGGTITEAVSTQVWSGEADVHVSIVNWVKGPAPGKKRLSWQEGDTKDSPRRERLLDEINPALSPHADVTPARSLIANVGAAVCYQGQTHGHAGFLLDPAEARSLIERSPRNADVIFPFLIGDDLLGRPDGSPSRYVIDFQRMDIHAARAYKEPFARVEAEVLPARRRAATREGQRNAEVFASVAGRSAQVNKHHAGFLDRWWQLSWGRAAMIAKLSALPRYIACARVTKRPIFEFISGAIRPNDAIQVFLLDDDYSFGVLQSIIHWRWFMERCSTLTRRFRYTSETVFDAFPFPQAPSRAEALAVAEAAVELRALRRRFMAEHGLSRRALYRRVEAPGDNPIKDAHAALDNAVQRAYGMAPASDPLALLLELNRAIAAREARGERALGPGLPESVSDPRAFKTKDCVEPRPLAFG